MEKKAFLGTWKDIPAANETQYTIQNVECTSSELLKQDKMVKLGYLGKRVAECVLTAGGI